MNDLASLWRAVTAAFSGDRRGASASPEPGRLRIDDLTFEPASGEIVRGDRRSHLPPQPSRLLAYMAARPGDVLSREELCGHLWPDRCVDYDSGLNFCIRQVREAVGDTAADGRIIETVPKRGYRLVASVVEEKRTGGRRDGRATREALVGWRSRAGWLAACGAATVGSIAFAFVFAGAAGGGGDVAALRGSDRPSESGSSAAAPSDESRSLIVVLPFEAPSGTGLESVLAAAATHELTTALSRVDPARLGVIASTSAYRAHEEGHSIPEVGERLGVAWVVHGAVLAGEGRSRVTMRLVRAADGVQVWAQSFFASAESLPDVWRTAVAKIQARLLPGAELGLAGRGGTEVAAAREAYLKGRYLLGSDEPDAGSRARAFLERAVELDPGFAAAWTELGRVQLRSGKPEEGMQALARGRELDPGAALPSLLVGNHRMFTEFDVTGAREDFVRALDAEPGLGVVHHAVSRFYSVLSEHEAAMRHVRRAVELDPVSCLLHGDIGRIHYWAGRPREAVDACRRALELRADDLGSRVCLIEASFEAGDLGTAAAEASALVADLTPGGTGSSPAESTPERTLEAFWRWTTTLSHEPGRSGLTGPFARARAHARLGEHEAALEWLEAAVASRDPRALQLRNEPAFEQLRGHARFRQLVRSLGLPATAGAGDPAD